MSETSEVRLFRNGRNQAVRIPVEFELPGTAATMRREDGRLVIEPLRTNGLLAWLEGLTDIEEDFDDLGEGLGPLREVSL